MMVSALKENEYRVLRELRRDNVGRTAKEVAWYLETCSRVYLAVYLALKKSTM